MRFTLVASDVDDDLRGRWKPLGESALVMATRADAPVIEKL